MRVNFLLALLLCGCSSPPRPPLVTPAPTALKIVNGLETPLQKGQSTVWSAALGLAWKQAEAELFKGPIILGDDPALRQQVCAGNLTGPDLPADWLELKSQRTDSVASVAASLTAVMPFSVPYFKNDEPLQFQAAGSQRSHPVASFGIRAKDEYAYYSLRKQVDVLFRTEAKVQGPVAPLDEYGVDLCNTSKPWRLVLAVIHPPNSLADGLERVARLTRECPRQPEYQYQIGPNDQLLVPEQHLECKGQESHTLKNPGWPAALQLEQRIQWELDRGGAELRVEAKMAVAPIPSLYYFDRPYLILVETRDRHQPVFAMWVGNAECLQPFGR
ncbi:MAG: hypothetical protein U0931_23735 [Vulcanimicrobiota bacterium]